MKKKRILIASIIFILIICIVAAVFIVKNRTAVPPIQCTHMALEMYDVIIHRTMYCILMIPEYCISSIRHQARTWSIAISPTAHMKDSRAPMRSPHVLQLFMV